MNRLNHHSTGSSSEQLSLFATVKTEVPLDTVHQYFIMIQPPEIIKSKVRSLKTKLNNAVELSDYNLNSSPIISLMSFHTMQPVNDRFINAVKDLFMRNNKLNIKLSGIEHFEHGLTSNTIYAKLQNSEPIIKLYQELHILLGLRIRSFVPHLTIARTVSRSKFQKSFSVVKKHSFEDEFVCEKITILERKLQHGVVGKYSVLKDISLCA